MALRFLYTGHGYNNTEFLTQQRSQLDFDIVFGASSTSQTADGRFPGTVGYTYGTFSQLGAEQTTTLFFQPDGIVFTAVDFRAANVASERFVTSLTDGRIIEGSSSPSTAYTAAGQFYTLATNISNFLTLRIGASVVGTGTINISVGVYYRITVEAKIDAVGYVKVYVNGVLDIDYSGNTTNSLSPILYRARTGSGTPGIRGAYIVWDTAGSSGFNSLYTDFIPVQLLPDGAGSSTQGTPVGAANNWQCVDETFRNGTTDYVTLDVVTAQKDLYTYSAVGLPGNVISVAMIPAANLATIGTARIKCETVSNGTPASTSASRILPNISAVAYGNSLSGFEFPVNPDTNAAWTVAEIDAAEFGVSATVS